MTRQEYEQKKRECWEEFRTHVICGTDNPKGWFERAFDRAYALGKKIGNPDFSDEEGEEMLTVKRSDVINEFDKLHKLSYKAADLQLGLNSFRTLFGSKCLPDENSSVVEEVSQQIGDKAVKYLEDYFEKQIDETKLAESKIFSKEYRLNIVAMQSLLSNLYGFIINGKD